MWMDFEQPGEDKTRISVRSDEVVSIEEINQEASRLVMKNGTVFHVLNPWSDVMRRMQGE